MTDGRRTAVLYARKSTKRDRSEEQSASVVDQLARCRSFAEQHGWQVIAEHADDGRSGLLDRSKRPGLNAALRSIEQQEADTLVTLWTSRLSREERQRAEYLDVMDVLGAEWHTVDDGGRVDRSSYAGYITYGIHSVMDTAYSKRVAENWRRAHQRRLDRGLPKTTSPRFGYRYDAERGYVVHQQEALVVRDLYRRYTRGEGFTPLAVWLDEQGWRVSGSDGAWTVRTLTRFMDSGFAAGLISREAKHRDLRGAHEALLTEQEWLAYLAEREQRAKLGRKASGASARWWLAGFVKCGRCGGATYVDSFNQQRSSVLCSTHRQNPAQCAGATILRQYVENAVGLWLGGHLDQLDALTVAASGDAVDAATAAYQDAVAARDKVADGLASLEVSRALGDMAEIVYQRARDDLALRLVVAEQDVKAAAAAMSAPAVDPQAVRHGVEEGWSPDAIAALRGVLSRVEVTPDALTIRPVTGDAVVIERSSLRASCNVSGCDRVAYTRGLCKSHVMRARKVGGEELLDALADHAHRSVLPADEVEELLTGDREHRGPKGVRPK